MDESDLEVFRPRTRFRILEYLTIRRHEALLKAVVYRLNKLFRC